MSTSSTITLPTGYRPAADLLADRTILVTGASGALGGAAARAYARHGATVVLLGKTVRRLEAIYDDIVRAGGPEPAIYPMNLEGAGPGDYEDLTQRLRDAFGHLDGLASCAALPGTPSPLEHQDVTEWLRVVHVNLHAPFLLSRSLLGLLRAAPDPALLFPLSALGRRARAYRGAYAVTQFALRGLVEVLADELEHEVRVNCLDPGPLRSALRAASHPAEDRTRLADPQDVVPALLYLIGPDAAGITGAWLSLTESPTDGDGGA
jgi:NAD(P)-dependent dehydrogenase (short-subunit alcohol dehydrogenase family)